MRQELGRAKILRNAGVMVVVMLGASAAYGAGATDNADNSVYTSDGWQLTDNGGSGYSAWVQLDSGGGTFLANSGSGNRQIEGNTSFAVFPNYSLARPLATPMTIGTYDVLGRHDLDNSAGFSGFNLKSAAGTAFGSSELLSFGMLPAAGNNVISVTDSTGPHTVTFPAAVTEIRGDIIDYNVTFNTTTGAYSLTATDTSKSNALATISGTLEATGAAVADAGFANFNNSGFGQNLIFDTPTFTPEPTGLATCALLMGAGLLRRSRRAR